MIIDAAYPVQSSKGKWICSLKVIDGSLHTEGDQINKEFAFAVIIIYANRFEDCPIVRQIGDVIRVHRANCKNYKGRRQYNVNVSGSASWSLFETNPKHALKGDDSNSDVDMADGEDGENEGRPGQTDYDPYKWSNKNYSIDMSVHKHILKALRKWAIDYLAKNMVVHISSFTALSKLRNQEDKEKGKDLDLLVKVLKVHEKDEQTVELRVKDMTSSLFFLNLPKLRFGGILNIRAGEIIRVRSVIPDTTSRRNIITHKQTTNILKFLPSAKIVSHMQTEIKDMTDTDKMLLEDCSEVLMSPVQLTEILGEEEKRREKSKPFRLQDLFLNFDSFSEEVRERNCFRVSFCVYRFDPVDSRDVVVAACPKCHDTISCKDLPADGAA